MGLDKEETGPAIATGPAPSSSVATDARNVSTGIVQGVKHPLRRFAEIPFTVPRWLDRLAIRAARRLGSEGRL